MEINELTDEEMTELTQILDSIELIPKDEIQINESEFSTTHYEYRIEHNGEEDPDYSSQKLIRKNRSTGDEETIADVYEHFSHVIEPELKNTERWLNKNMIITSQPDNSNYIYLSFMSFEGRSGRLFKVNVDDLSFEELESGKNLEGHDFTQVLSPDKKRIVIGKYKPRDLGHAYIIGLINLEEDTYSEIVTLSDDSETLLKTFVEVASIEGDINWLDNNKIQYAVYILDEHSESAINEFIEHREIVL